MSVRTVMIVAAIPTLAALGHDAYLFFTHIGIENIANDVRQIIEDKGAGSFFASLGFIWTSYSPDSYKWVAASLDEGTWEIINSLLSFKAFFVGLTIIGLVYGVLGFLKMTGHGLFRDKTTTHYASSSRLDQLLGRKKKVMQYKRKK